jgi:hypothetical protein
MDYGRCHDKIRCLTRLAVGQSREHGKGGAPSQSRADAVESGRYAATRSTMNTLKVNNLRNEFGGARLKLIVFIVIFAAILYAGYLYIPVAVDAYYYKDIMQNLVNQAAAQGSDSNWLSTQLTKIGPDYHVPSNAAITASVQDKRVTVHVQFTRPISTPVYTYNYEFDHTAQSTTFLTK